MWQHDWHTSPQEDRPELRNLSWLSKLGGPSHHSGSWYLRLVPPFTWTGGVSPPASLCPSTVMAVRGVTLGLRRRLCRPTGHRSAPGDPAVTQIGEAMGAPFATCLPYREWAATIGAGHGGCPL